MGRVATVLAAVHTDKVIVRWLMVVAAASASSARSSQRDRPKHSSQPSQTMQVSHAFLDMLVSYKYSYLYVLFWGGENFHGFHDI